MPDKDTHPPQELVHELRNALAPLMAHARILLDQVVDGVARATAEEVLLGARRLERQLEAFDARVDALDLTCTDVGRVCRETCRHLLALAWQHGVTLRCDCRGVLLAWCDEERIEQVVVNLARNAIEACAPGGTVSVECGLCDGRLRVAVSDTGAGFDRPLATVISEGHSRKGGPGHGIGLKLCDRIVGAHGGQLAASGRPGGGTEVSFSVAVPVEGRRPASRRRVRAERAAARGGVGAPEMPGVVIADDDPHLVRALCHVIATRARPHTFTCPRAALAEAAARGDVTRAIIDVGQCAGGVPELLALADALLGAARGRVRLIAATGAMLGPGDVESLEHAGVALLRKPFDGPTVLRILFPHDSQEAA